MIYFVKPRVLSDNIVHKVHTFFKSLKVKFLVLAGKAGDNFECVCYNKFKRSLAKTIFLVYLSLIPKSNLHSLPFSSLIKRKYCGEESSHETAS